MSEEGNRRGEKRTQEQKIYLIGLSKWTEEQGGLKHECDGMYLTSGVPLALLITPVIPIVPYTPAPIIRPISIFTISVSLQQRLKKPKRN